MLDKAKINDEVDKLVAEGTLLHISIYKLSKEGLAQLKKQNIAPENLPDFNSDYETWYTKCYDLIHNVANYRLNDFVSLYKCENRKTLSLENYCIQDALLGFNLTQYGNLIASPESIIGKVKAQVQIVNSLKTLIIDYFYNLNIEIQYSFFDSELDSAYILLKKKFFRAAGAIAGVVLEKHLQNVCKSHSISIKKKDPTLADCYDILKEQNVLDLIQWRKLQYLGDIRNSCCHNKSVEPTSERVKELLDGTKYIISNLA